MNTLLSIFTPSAGELVRAGMAVVGAVGFVVVVWLVRQALEGWTWGR